jgi:hypothetical protein
VRMKIARIVIEPGGMNCKIYGKAVATSQVLRESLHQISTSGMRQLMWQCNKIFTGDPRVLARLGALGGIPQRTPIVNPAHIGGSILRWQYDFFVQYVGAM